jgi:ATP-binding cassette subfamily B multidrug efflux pump
VPSPPSAEGRTVWTYLARYRGRIGLGVAMLLATNLLYLGIPIYQGAAVDALDHGDPGGDVPRYAIFLIGFAVATAMSRIVSRTTIFNAARAAEYDLRSDLFGRLLRLDPPFHRAHPTGDVMSRLTNDVQTVRAMWGAGVLNIVNTIFAFATVLVMMVRVDPWLTLWAIVPYPTIVVVGRVFGRRIYKTSREVQAQLGAMSNQLQEDLGGMHVIKTYGQSDVRRRHFQVASEKLLDANMAMTRVRGQLVPVLAALGSLGTVIVIFIGGRSVIQGTITIGQLIEFSAYLARLVWPTLALGWMMSLLQRGRASWTRIEDLLVAEPTIADGSGPPLVAPAGRVDVKGLTVTIDGRTILDGIDLHLEPGTFTAVVGRTGSGKSTLVDALCRLIDVPAGTVFVDGRDITTLPLASLRGAIGYAPQEAFLFSTTIADNIAMGYGAGSALPRARADELSRIGALPTSGDQHPVIGDSGEVDPRIRAAAEAAGLARDLAAMPEGYATVVGERGITLSGGQRQRVALARALASTPPILILDDSLSSVDASTEHVILERLRDVLRGRTAILISHRVAAVKGADQIAVLDGGRIVERGTHAALLARGGLYAELYATQIDPDEIAQRVEHASHAPHGVDVDAVKGAS